MAKEVYSELMRLITGYMSRLVLIMGVILASSLHLHSIRENYFGVQK